MFELNQKLNRLDIPAQKVLRMKRSLNDVQVALPGQKAQMAAAYICAFSAGKGIRVAVVLLLREDYKLIYYLNDGGEISSGNAGSVLNQAVDFAESLGFMMNDLEFHKMEPAEKSEAWESLPLKNPPVKPQPPAPAKTAAPPVDEEVIEETEELSAEESVELDLGLPLRKLAIRKKKEPPSPAEIEKKKNRLRANLGRFLSSL